MYYRAKRNGTIIGFAHFKTGKNFNSREIKLKPGLKQANTSMSVPPLTSYEWAITQEE